MKIIGICGGSGSGKTVICSALQKKGAAILDADQISRELYTPGSPLLEQIVQAFGEEYRDAQGQLRRQALGERVFSDPDSLKKLNAITHPAICKEIKRRIQTQTAQLIVIDAALLFQTGLDQLCHYTIAIVAPEQLRLQRIVSRDNISQESALARIRAQQKNDAYIAQTDFAWVNDDTCTPEEIASEIIERMNRH